jgi:hypothetical protein
VTKVRACGAAVLHGVGRGGARVCSCSGWLGGARAYPADFALALCDLVLRHQPARRAEAAAPAGGEDSVAVEAQELGLCDILAALEADEEIWADAVGLV